MTKRRAVDWWICPSCGCGYSSNTFNDGGRCGDLSYGGPIPCDGILVPSTQFYQEWTRRFATLDACARLFGDDPAVVGFRVVGSSTPYAKNWDTESASPARWRSGEWSLVSGGTSIDPVFRSRPRLPMRDKELPHWGLEPVPVERVGRGWVAVGVACPAGDLTGKPACVEVICRAQGNEQRSVCEFFHGLDRLSVVPHALCTFRREAKINILEQVAEMYQDDPDVIGFRVYGSKEMYEEQWNKRVVPFPRWRSGEWILEGGNDGFEPIFRSDRLHSREGNLMREPVVKFYKDEGPGGNGAFATATTAQDPEEFLRGCADEMEVLLEDRMGDWQFTMLQLLPQICELWAKLKGYKADGVFEKRYLVAGEPNPEAHMRLVNQPHIEAPPVAEPA